MSPSKSRKLKLAVAWTLIAFGGLIAGGLGYARGAAALYAIGTWAVLGGLAGAGWLLRRMTEQREALRNLSAAVEHSHSAVLIIDSDGCVEFANRSACQLFGYARPKLLGQKWARLSAAQPSGAGVTEVLATARAGATWQGEWVGRREDGSVYAARGVATPVKHRDGSVGCVVAAFDDVTETRRREAELREARDRAEAGDRAKGQFLATMSHEIRTPLNGIAGFTTLLLDTELTNDQRDCLQTIKASTEALIQLTGDVLDYARIESGKLTLDPIACDPRECVEDALDFVAAKAAEKRVELLHRVAPDVPAAVVIDGGRLRQVLVNLVANAVKFTEKGEVEVSVAKLRDPERRAESAPPSTEDASCEVVFTVRDTGIGIAAEHQGKLFRPFSQVDDSTTRRYGGTGLGLAIARSLVGMMGGTIRVSSEPAQGSSFTFTVRAPIAAAEPTLPDLRGMRVGLALHAPALRSEIAALVRTWQGDAIDCDSLEQLAAAECDSALVELDEEAARDLLTEPARLKGLAAETTLGLVPSSLPNDLRGPLRAHFRVLVNKPVHHGALFALLSGTKTFLPPPTPHTRFGFRVLVVVQDAQQRHVQRALGKLGCTLTLAGTGRDALEQLARSAHDFDLMLLECPAAEADGQNTLREIRAGHAGTPAQTMWIIALHSGAAERAAAHETGDGGLNDSLTLPLQIGALEAALRKFRSERLARKS